MLPKYVEVIEVGPRDGFQNIKEWIPTDTKLKIIEGLIACGFKRMEVTSFVHPKAIPQMADSAEVLGIIRSKYPGLKKIALAPNLYGAKKAIEAGADEITFVISASERHNLENTRQTHEQSIAALAEVCKMKGTVKVRLAVATTFDCPFSGRVPLGNVVKLIEAGLQAGADDVYFADTIGTADPVHVEEVVGEIQRRYPNLPITLHIHDTRGMGLANVVTALNMGVTRFEAAVGGLGGCPFAPGAAGNIATEDMINMLHQMKIETNIDLEQLIKVARLTGELLPAVPTGHMVRAGTCN